MLQGAIRIAEVGPEEYPLLQSLRQAAFDGFPTRSSIRSKRFLRAGRT